MERSYRRLLSIVGTFIIVFIFGIGSEFYRDFIKPAFVSPTPTPYQTRTPPAAYLTTTARIAAYTPTPSCLLWSEVTAQMEGRTVCVYGTVIEYREDWDNFISNIYFGTRQDFYIVSNYRWDVSPVGECLTATGKIQLNTYKIPYIKIQDSFNFCQ